MLAPLEIWHAIIDQANELVTVHSEGRRAEQMTGFEAALLEPSGQRAPTTSGLHQARLLGASMSERHEAALRRDRADMADMRDLRRSFDWEPQNEWQGYSAAGRNSKPSGA